ncbi:MAG: alanine dehydrogenase [Okeania sp. SIO2C2]|uniref:N(5)-(carboxyethyl)ornithine synthase n=1 Tax=Okeania sp. SIO2C2 TaxID=2607787 RepID=UPI0013BE45E2|nr:N(5)-(carboxyethyl)ornithine synthase [Okeania sp. SIO2C2]NEP90278.1 alanine dehydrogenase [Okeania sp. SIO2C2]
MLENQLTMGIVGTSNKENEFRVPIFPSHFERIDEHLRKRIFIENGYGDRFNVSKKKLEVLFAGIMSREELFKKCDIILLLKPTQKDFIYFQEGQILWGWTHCVQGESITQVGIDKKMTFISNEAMFTWKLNESKGIHIFHKNNEIAGYCSVLHALQLAGLTGYYGPPRKVAILSFGSTAKGALQALLGQGFHDIYIYSQRSPYTVSAPISSSRIKQFMRYKSGSTEVVVKESNGKTKSIAEELASYDIIVNCTLQDTDYPIMYFTDGELELIKEGTLIIDVSCDYKMGFSFAVPNSFEKPTVQMNRGITYYAVDHTPTYLWNSSTYEISQCIIPFINVVMGGKEAWQKNMTIDKAIEIQDGNILNNRILRFQNRKSSYPYSKL